MKHHAIRNFFKGIKVVDIKAYVRQRHVHLLGGKILIDPVVDTQTKQASECFRIRDIGTQLPAGVVQACHCWICIERDKVAVVITRSGGIDRSGKSSRPF